MTRKKKAGLVPGKFLAEVGEGRTIAAFEPGKVIFTEGDSANALFCIQKGKAKITVVTKAGEEALIAMLGAGDFLGEGCLAGQPLRISTATAMTECWIMRLERATVWEMLQQDPAFSERLLSYMSTRSVRIEEDLMDQLFNRNEIKLARTLLLLANF